MEERLEQLYILLHDAESDKDYELVDEVMRQINELLRESRKRSRK